MIFSPGFFSPTDLYKLAIWCHSHRMGKAVRDLGTAGEASVKDWCAIAGITVNKSHIDRYGWDLFFELERPGDISLARDLHVGNIECKVQIKATDGDRKVQPIKLSGLHAMVTTPLPAFYILLEYAGGDRPVAGFLLHIDESHCEKILKRIREEVAKSKNVKLNRKTMSLGFHRARKIEPLNGAGLKAAIIEAIGPSQGNYVVRKQEVISSVGYAPGSLKVNFNVNEKDLQDFIGMALGNKSRIEVMGLKTFITRFGVQEEVPDMRSDTAILSVTNVLPDGHAQVMFRNPKNGNCFEYDLETYRGGLSHWVPDRYKVLRLSGQRFTLDISLQSNSLRMWFHEEDDVPVSVKELLKLYRLVTMLSIDDDIDMIITIEGKSIKGRMKDKLKLAGAEAGALLDSVIRIQNFFGYYDDLKASPAELNGNALRIINFDQRVSSPENDVKFNISFTLNDPMGGLDSLECVTPMAISIGDVGFVCMYVYGGDLNLGEDGEFQFVARWKKLLYKTCFKVSSSTVGEIIQELSRVADAYESDCQVFDMTDTYIESFLKDLH